MILKNLNYPLDFKFKIITLSSDFNITDRHGNYVAYVREKMFKLKEDVIVFNDESKSQELFRIKADRWLDFNASYSMTDLSTHKTFGRLARKGMRSIWKSQYDIIDAVSYTHLDVYKRQALLFAMAKPSFVRDSINLVSGNSTIKFFQEESGELLSITTISKSIFCANLFIDKIHFLNNSATL